MVRMQLIALIVIVVIIWFLYGLLDSYRGIERELREIRLKCMMPADTERKDPITRMKAGVMGGLVALKDTARKQQPVDI